ncbi:MAG: pyridoxal-phosphate-dependent aminotransferase family protein [Candidatus Altarchaeaceae archaeon]
MKKPMLFTVGPVYVEEDVLKEMSHQMFSHRSDEYRELHKNLIEKLKKFMKTKNEIFIFTSSSTGVMESIARNLIDENDNALCISNGAFGERFAEVFKYNGKKFEILKKEWREGIFPEEVDEFLKKDDKISLVTLVHNETSTGVMNKLKEISKVVKAYNVLFCVDTVSSIGGAEVNVDEYKIDVCFFGTQKCLGVPPSMAIASISDKALEKSKNVKNKGFYFNYEILKKSNEKNESPVTPPIPQMFALTKSLDLIENEGLENRILRHKKVSEYVRKRIKEMEFEIFPDENFASPTLTCVDVRKFKEKYNKFDIQEMNKEMKKRGFILAAGYGKIKDITFRIGNMGNVKMDDVEEMLNNLEDVINKYKK